MYIYIYVDIQIYRYTNIFRYTDIQVYRYVDIQIYIYTDIQICRYTDCLFVNYAHQSVICTHLIWVSALHRFRSPAPDVVKLEDEMKVIEEQE